MYGLADISLFESVTNYRCAVFNDTYSDVVEGSDPLASRPKRIRELVKRNPVKKGDPEVIGDITEKIKGEKEDSDSNDGVGEYLDSAYGSLRKLESHIKKLCSAGKDRGCRLFAKKHGKKIRQIYECADRLWSNLKSFDHPKHKTVIVIKQGTLPETAMRSLFDQQMSFADRMGSDLI